MRWRSKPPRREPRDGDFRVVTRWLITPRCLRSCEFDGLEWRWLERARITQTCHVYTFNDGFDEETLTTWEDSYWTQQKTLSDSV